MVFGKIKALEMQAVRWILLANIRMMNILPGQ